MLEVERVSLNEVIGEIISDANYEARQRRDSEADFYLGQPLNTTLRDGR